MWLVAAEATREQRAASIDRLVERVIDGDNVMLLCHCRRWGTRPCASNRCHGDGIVRTVLKHVRERTGGACVV